MLSALKRNDIEINLDELNSDSLPFESITDPVKKERLLKYSQKLFDEKKLKAGLEKHIQRLDQHLTRLFRIRNEIVHEGKSMANLALMNGHLRHYLLFSIEQITNELSKNHSLSDLDDVFVYFENLVERIKSAKDIKEIFEIKKFVGYME